MSDKTIFYPENPEAWRAWLAKNHDTEQSVWVKFYKIKTGIPSLSWSEAVSEALCFGWIDSTKKTLDEESYIQFFTRRKPTSTWSKINKDKVQWLFEKGRMMPAGIKSVEIAKGNGMWTLLDDVEALIIPKDLEEALNASPDAKSAFDGFTKSIQKGLLYWIVTAKRPETRQKRIREIAENASNGVTPKNFR